MTNGGVMRILKWLLGSLLMLVLVTGAAALWKRDEIARLMAVNSLFAPEKIVANFSQMDDLFFHRTLSRGTGPVSPLPVGPAAALPPDAAQWVIDRNITSLVVLHQGRLVHEILLSWHRPR